jgi:hypothetical protein
MATNSLNNVSARRNQFIAAWRENAPEATFDGSTLAQFEAETLEPFNVSLLMEEAKAVMSGLMMDRDQAHAALNRKLVMVAKAVRGHFAYGEDSKMYRAMGYVPLSERQSGLTRKMKNATAPTPSTASAA